jgi:caa(3)-type oxidase subunit IV
MSDASHSHEDIRRHVVKYLWVFGTLLVLTIVTVGVSYLNLPLPTAIAVALAIATLKASLVAAVFMHLSSEKKIILWILAMTAAFFVVVLFSSVLHPL